MQFLYAPVDIALFGGCIWPHHMLGFLRVIIVEEVPNHFVGSERIHELALIVLNLSLFNNINWFLDLGCLIRYDFGLLLSLVHSGAISLRLQISVDQFLN
jgi:hypothetical protein